MVNVVAKNFKALAFFTFRKFFRLQKESAADKYNGGPYYPGISIHIDILLIHKNTKCKLRLPAESTNEVRSTNHANTLIRTSYFNNLPSWILAKIWISFTLYKRNGPQVVFWICKGSSSIDDNVSI